MYGSGRRLALVLVVMLAVVACGGAATPPAKPAAEPAKAAAPAPAPPAAAPAAPAAPAAQPAAPKAPEKAPAPEAKPAAAKPAAAPMQALVGTTQSTSGHYAYFVGVAKTINAKVPELNVTIVETGASVENANRLAKGEFPFALINPDVAYRAQEGLEQFKDKAIKDIRTLWIYSVSPSAYVVRADSGVKTLADLEGKEYNPGMRGSATEAQTKKAAEVLGIKPRWFTGGTEDAMAAVRDRRIVGMTKTFIGMVVDAVILDLQVATSIRILAFGKDQLAQIVKVAPWYGHSEIPANMFKMEENRVAIPTLVLVQGTHTLTKFDENLAYKVVRAIFEDNKLKERGLQAGAMPAVKDIDFEKTTIEQAKVPLHKGVLKYYREIGAKIPDALVPPEAK